MNNPLENPGIQKVRSVLNRGWVQSLAFTVLFLLISLSYDYLKIMDKPPMSYHCWRQSDGASMALNYYQYGMDFFEFRMHNDLDNGGGYAVGEFPILYYAVGGLYHVFGPEEVVYRVVWFLLTYLGLLYLFKLGKRVTGSFWWATIASLFMLTSPIIAYYGVSYIPDPMGVAFLFIGLYHFHVYYYDDRRKSLIWASSFFALAGLIKITALFPVVAIGLLIFGHAIYTAVRNKKSTALLQTTGKYIPLLVSALVVAAWYLFAMKYNEDHNVVYYYTSIDPYWTLNADQIAHVNEYLSNWYYHYHLDLWYYVLIALVPVTVLFGWKHAQRKEYLYVSLLSIACAILGVLLWYMKLADHDYYAASYLAVFPLLILTFGRYLKDASFPKWIRITTIIIFLILTNMALNNARKNLDRRFFGEPAQAYFETYGNLHDIRPFLREQGLDKETKVVSIPDISTNVSLYLMNVQGWNNLYDQNLTTEGIRASKEKGAEYLIIHKKDWLEKDFVEPFTIEENLVGEKDGVYIYKL